VLPPLWQTITLFNPLVYLISGFRWSFYGIADVRIEVSLAMTLLFLALCYGRCPLCAKSCPKVNPVCST
jgi:ABC-2 type transport system permease protein